MINGLLVSSIMSTFYMIVGRLAVELTSVYASYVANLRIMVRHSWILSRFKCTQMKIIHKYN